MQGAIYVRTVGRRTETSPALTRREVAELAEIPLSSVDKAIEQGIVRPRRRGRQSLLTIQDLVLLAILRRVGMRLPLNVKRRIRNWIREQAPHRTRRVRDLGLTSALLVRSGPEVADLTRRAERYVAARGQLIESNPDIRGGEPIVRGTRVPVRGLARQIELGESPAVLREDYPQIPEEAYEVARVWARTHPRRGRPAPPWRSSEAVDRRVPVADPRR